MSEQSTASRTISFPGGHIPTLRRESDLGESEAGTRLAPVARRRPVANSAPFAPAPLQRRVSWFASRPGATISYRGLVLLVTDSDADALLPRDLLRGAGFRTTVRVGGREGLAALSQELPDVILLACWRRPTDPVAILQALRDRPDLRARCLVVRPPGRGEEVDPLFRHHGVRGIVSLRTLHQELSQHLDIPPPSASTRGKAPEPGPGLCIADRYVLECKLGTGATAEVFRARDSELMQPVAIKVLRDSGEIHDQTLRFRREARVGRLLHHPSIVQFYEFGTWTGLLYMTMELVRGTTLRERFDARADYLPLAEALDIVRQGAQALAVAHERGIAHRDVKPANFMMTPDGTVKLMDFGLSAGGIDDQEVPDGEWLQGTPHYLSPERILGAPEPCLSGDVWALGLVLYEALTGQSAFQAPP